ncbi:MAG: ATP-binding protein [Chthoniobacteraceae bacterium]
MDIAQEQEIKAAFLEYNRDLRIACAKIAYILVVIFMPVGALLDYFIYPEEFGFFLTLRLVCSALALALWAVNTSPFGRRHYQIIGMGWFMLPILFMCLMIYYTEGARSPYYAGLNLVLIAGTFVALADFWECLVAVGLTVLSYLAACVGHGGGTAAEYFNNFYFIALTGVVAVSGSFLIYRLRYREYFLRAELDSNRRQLQENNAKLIELDRAKSTFFANVSHELRTPLTLLLGPLERLRNIPSGSHEAVEMLDIMFNNSMRLLRLINDLLDLVRLDSGTIRVKRKQVELVPFMEGVAKSVAPMASQRNLNFEGHLDAAPDTFVYIDRDKLEKIILNLLFNSFKFTAEKGTVSLRISMEGKMLKAVVTDSGKGIACDELPRIFDRFWQAESAATRRYQGVGIGLALVKELTEAHGGHVEVESELGKGTTFTVTVDAEGEPESEMASVSDEPVALDPPDEGSEWLDGLYRRAELFPSHIPGINEPEFSLDDPEAGKPHILVADDEPEMRRFLYSQLKEFYSVHEARNGSEALEMARTWDFSLMLLDLMMPGIDGITLTRQLREEPRTASVPIIILTARADEGSKMQALEAGVSDFLTKPFASSELMARCRNLYVQRLLQENLLRKSNELEETLVQLKATEAQMVHQAKMASMGQLSSGLMHEINNPLNFANTASFLLQKRLLKIPEEYTEPLKAPLADLQAGIRRVADIISSLRSFLHPDTSNFSQVPLLEVVQTSIRFVQIPEGEISLEVNIPQDLAVWGNRNQLIHLMINLLQNAADSLRDKGAPEKKIKIEAGLQNGRILMTCEDNGKGITASDQEKIFDAFFTTKPVGSGMGLGLNISYRIVQNHKGELKVESQENEFCRFLVTLNPKKP